MLYIIITDVWRVGGWIVDLKLVHNMGKIITLISLRN